ncbi:polysaccharide pyruvyl transferase family protein [Priestia megaterium]|jgi:hypothetical protein
MKICTITCHDVYNHGASLQAYGLMKYLMNCGHEVEIIDYKPDYLSNHYNLLSIDNPKWEKNIITKSIYLTLKIPTRISGLKRKKAFDRFTSQYLTVTNSRFISNHELKRNIPYADAYICGSDQIWNTLHRNGKDPAFYLDFVPNGKIKASYAASFATDTISDEYKPMVKEKVERLEGVGVREKSGVEILKKLDINKAVHVVDPVFLLDKEDWNNIGTREFKEKYILIYDFDNSVLIKNIAIKIAKEKGYKIYTINPGKLNYADRYFKFDGPETFVSLVRNAQFIISNSFHAAVFSVIYEKDFIIVNRTEAINTRMRDLLSDLNIRERLISENYSLNQILKKIDYKKSKKILNEKITFSKKYLEDVLSRNRNVRNIL